MNKLAYYILLCLIPFCKSYAQVADELPLLRQTISGTNKAKAVYKGQVVNKKKTGMAFITYKDGSVYVGDVFEGIPNGKGTFFVAEGKKINGCPDARVYTGHFKDGMKNGRGRCYNAFGFPIYEGKFANDLPESTFPNENSEFFNEYVSVRLPNGNVFLGELQNGIFNGAGILIFPNGDLMQNSFKDGICKGIGLFMQNNGEWFTIKSNGDEMITISSSEYYDDIRRQRNKINSVIMLAAVSNFMQATANALGTINTVNTGLSYSSEKSNVDTSRGNSATNYEYIYKRYEKVAEGAYKSLTNVGYRTKDNDGNYTGGYSGMSSIVSQMGLQKTLIQAQQQMRSTRAEAQRHGVTITPSQYESVDVN